MAIAAESSPRSRSDAAHRYARLWSPAIRGAGERLVAQMSLSGAQVVVDVGTGTGNLLPAIRAVAAPSAHIVAIDASEPMVRVSPVRETFCIMDLRAPSLRPAIADAAVMSFVVFQLPDPAAALAHVASLLRDGGCLGLTTWHEGGGRHDHEIWTQELVRAGAQERVQPANSDALTDTPEKIEGLLAGAGFVDRKVWIEPHEHRWDADELFELGEGDAADVLASLDELAGEDVRARVRARLIAEIPDGRAVNKQVIFAVAHAPRRLPGTGREAPS